MKGLVFELSIPKYVVAKSVGKQFPKVHYGRGSSLHLAHDVAPAKLPARCQKGSFVEPTVITGLDAACRVNQEEIFGPVVTILPFRDERGLVAQANGTAYGLSASVWTRDVARAHRVAEQLECGTVWVNCWLLRDLRVPFGGVKSSGVGREGGEEALRFFTEPKTVCIKYHTGEY